MKRKLSVLIILLICLFSFYYFYKENKLSRDLWDVVSSKSALIIELDYPVNQYNLFLNELKNSKLRFALQDITKSYSSFDKVIDGKIEKLLYKNKVIISYFNISNKTLEPVYYIFKKNLDEDFIIKYLNDKDFNINKRTLNGEIIYEAKKNQINHTFSFIDGLVVYSKNSLIIEDVIRSLGNSKLTFKKNNSTLFTQVKIKKDLGNLFINYDEIEKILSSIFPQNFFAETLKVLPSKSFYDINISDGFIRMNGFSSEIESKNIIGKSNYDSIINFIPSNTILYTNINSISKILVQSLSSNTSGRIIIFKPENNQIIQNKNNIKEEIFSLNDINIFKRLQINDFNKDHYFFMYNDYMILSESFYLLNETKALIDDKDFLIKNMEFNKFQKELNSNHNILVIYDIGKLLPSNNSNIGYLSVQLSDIENKYYMSLNITEEKTNSSIVEKDIINDFSFQNNLSSKPHIIFSHIDNRPEVIIQDEKNFIYQLSNKLNPIWSDSIEKINSKIFEIDYYKNNKKQILFSSSNKIYSYDRKGNSLIGFPFKNPSESAIKFLNVIDYDKSKRYRIITSHDNGEIYFLNKSGSILDGWNPLKMEDDIVQSPFHVRVSGKDYIIIILKNGTIHVKNRRGVNYKGFPVKLNSEISNKVYLKKSIYPDKTILKLLTDEGTVYELNLKGKILSSKDQYRDQKDSKFLLVHEQTGKNPIIISYDDYNLIYGENKISFNNIKNAKLQYYNLSNSENFLILTDRGNNKTYFLDENLKYYFDPVSNQNEISLLKYSNSLILYKTLNNRISMIELKK